MLTAFAVLYSRCLYLHCYLCYALYDILGTPRYECTDFSPADSYCLIDMLCSYLYYTTFYRLIQLLFCPSSITCVNSMDASYIPIAEARGFTTHWIRVYLGVFPTPHLSYCHSSVVEPCLVWARGQEFNSP